MTGVIRPWPMNIFVFICAFVISDASILTTCGHRFCYQCILQYCTNDYGAEKKCPCCRQSYTKDNIVKDLETDKVVKSLMVQTKCGSGVCLSNIETHQDDCETCIAMLNPNQSDNNIEQLMALSVEIPDGQEGDDNDNKSIGSIRGILKQQTPSMFRNLERRRRINAPSTSFVSTPSVIDKDMLDSADLSESSELDDGVMSQDMRLNKPHRCDECKSNEFVGRVDECNECIETSMMHDRRRTDNARQRPNASDRNNTDGYTRRPVIKFSDHSNKDQRTTTGRTALRAAYDPRDSSAFFPNSANFRRARDARDRRDEQNKQNEQSGQNGRNDENRQGGQGARDFRDNRHARNARDCRSSRNSTDFRDRRDTRDARDTHDIRSRNLRAGRSRQCPEFAETEQYNRRFEYAINNADHGDYFMVVVDMLIENKYPLDIKCGHLYVQNPITGDNVIMELIYRGRIDVLEEIPRHVVAEKPRDMRNKAGVSPTHLAIAYGDIRALTWLRDNELQSNFAYREPITDHRIPLLHLAFSYGYPEVVKFLIKYCDADPYEKDSSRSVAGSNPLLLLPSDRHKKLYPNHRDSLKVLNFAREIMPERNINHYH